MSRVIVEAEASPGQVFDLVEQVNKVNKALTLLDKDKQDKENATCGLVGHCNNFDFYAG